MNQVSLLSIHCDTKNRPDLETRIGGVKSPKIGGGVKILNFRGSLNLTPFYRGSIEILNLGESKVQALHRQLSGRVPPRSSVRYVLTPPYPGLRLMSRCQCAAHSQFLSLLQSANGVRVVIKISIILVGCLESESLIQQTCPTLVCNNVWEMAKMCHDSY